MKAIKESPPITRELIIPGFPKPSFEDSIKEMEGLGATKTAERFKLKQRYPGISEDLLTKMLAF